MSSKKTIVRKLSTYARGSFLIGQIAIRDLGLEIGRTYQLTIEPVVDEPVDIQDALERDIENSRRKAHKITIDMKV